MWKALKRWTDWMDRQGFYVVLTVCVAVIVGSALWARHPQAVEDPGLTVDQAPDFVQSLAEVTPRPSPSPTPAPLLRPPVAGRILRGFSPTLPVYQATLDAWAAHMGVDLSAETGETVVAVADGEVTAIAKQALSGLTLEITHSEGRVSRYMGLKTVQVALGATVRAGQAVATAGGTYPAEALDPLHLHFEWWVDGQAVDPMEILP